MSANDKAHASIRTDKGVLEADNGAPRADNGAAQDGTLESGTYDMHRVPTDREVAEALVASSLEVGTSLDNEPKDHIPADDSDASSVIKESLNAKEDPVINAEKNGPASTMAIYDPSKLYELPPYLDGPLTRTLRWGFFSVYRKIYTMVFFFNFAWGMLGFALDNYGDGIYQSGNLASDTVAIAVAANVMVSIVIRNEHIINVLFATFTAVPHWAPLWIRRASAMIYSYGGLHSGCSTAATVWFAIFTGVATNEYITGRQSSPAIVILAYLLLVLLLVIIVLALPSMRARYHNWFECVHRFAGWTVLGVFWSLLIASAVLGGRRKQTSAGITLISSPSFWFLLVATVAVIYPWARLRHRQVEVEPLSAHAVRLHFDYGHHALCSAIRLTDRPLIENHAFATINRPDGNPGFSCVVSSAGDWTKRIIKNPPTKLYVRSGPAQGMAAITKLFSPVVMIATGSGIGPCLGFFTGRPQHNVHVIWSTRNPEKTYGVGIIQAVLRADPNALIIDTDKTGRPDLVALAYKMYRDTNSEAISIISNKTLVEKVVFEMESRGIPAYGPIWDS